MLATEAARTRMLTPLYTYNGTNVGRSDFLSGLRAVGVRTGDTIFVHSAVLAFGKPVISENRVLLATLSDALKKAVGKNGTVIMPTFTYSFTKKEPFDVRRTPSGVGSLTEHFRKERTVIRTRHPLFSVAIWGKKATIFSKTLLRDSFGKGTIFDLLHKENAKIVFLGASIQSMTFLHYVEQMHGVPYRYMKSFAGIMIDGKKKYPAECSFYVRYLSKNVETDTAKLEAALRKKKLLCEARVGGGVIRAVEARDCFKEGMRMLDDDIYSLLKKRPS